MKYFILILALFCFGCAAMERIFAPPIDPQTGQQTGDSVAVTIGRFLAPFAGPYGTMGLGGLMAIQNGYLIARRKRRGKIQSNQNDSGECPAGSGEPPTFFAETGGQT